MFRVSRGAAASALQRLVTRAGATALTTRRILVLGAAGALASVLSVSATLVTASTVHDLYFDRANLPDLGPFTRFELSTIGHIYDVNGQPLVELAREYRHITPYAEIPPVVRDAILATEDKNFFSHNGVDYMSLPRVLGKVRLGTWLTRLVQGSVGESGAGPPMFPQGGSTITQQLVRGLFLQRQTSAEASDQLRSAGLLPRVLSSMLGARNVNMMLRKREEMRLSLWVEREMRNTFGSKRRAKEEIFARYASFVYMGRGQYGFSRAAEHYLDRRLATLNADDANLAALLAGVMKAPRDYSPTSAPGPVLRRRNQILALMAAEGFISRDQMTAAQSRRLPAVVPRASQPFRPSAVVEHVLDELRAVNADLGIEDLLQGSIQVHSTVDAHVQRIVSDALEHGLARYEARHPRARGVVQGSVVVLSNRDASILAEAGGRQVYRGRMTSSSDFNRVRRSLRQPGSAMKPIVYLAAFEQGSFSLETLVPDEPISVPGARADVRKWISNYDGRFTGLIPIRKALAESRNAVAVWLTGQIGIDAVLRTSRRLGVRTPLQRYASTALGASEVNLLELATAYRTIASGVVATPFVIRRIVLASGDAIPGAALAAVPVGIGRDTLALIQEGLRGVVRIPTGTAHVLASRAFPIAVMGKTGTTNEFRDALFVGSTYGIDGVTVAVRIGFDDNRTLGSSETGGRVALPVFQEVMMRMYQDELAGPAPSFPAQMEQRISRYLQGNQPTPLVNAPAESGVANVSLTLSRLSPSDGTAP